VPRSLIALTLTVVVLAGAVSPASADTGMDRIRDFFGNVNRLLLDPVYEDRLPERLGAIRALVVELVDFRTAATLALGGEWAARTPGERDEFTRLFTDLLQTSMFASIGGRARIATDGLTVSYIGELPDRDGVTVATSVLLRAGTEMAVGYRMARRHTGWAVYDVIIDGVSLVDNYRAQFTKVIARSSYASLVDEMRGRLADLGGSTTPVVAQNAPGRVELVASQAIVAARRASERGATPAPAAVVPTTTGAATASSAGSPASASTTTVATAVAPADSPTVAPVTTVVAAVGPIRAPAAAPRDWTPVVTREPALVRESALPDLPARERTSDGRALLSTKWAAPRSGTPYWVQVGAFQSLDRLVDTASALRDQSVTLVTEPDHPLTRVMVGPFTDRATAASKVRELRARGYQAFIAEASK
jgi:phospholipid transport system substrate-binding protein